MRQEEKQSIYDQIDSFNNRPSNPQVENSKPVVDAYLYVDREVAEDRAEFFKWALENTSIFEDINFDTILDLAFGSGNLTSHLVLDSDIEYTKIYFNDKIVQNTNQELKINDSSEILNYDFFDYCMFQERFSEEKIDLLIFNPQIGGAYTLGKIDINENLRPVLFDGNILDYLEDNKIDTTKAKYKDFPKHRLTYLRFSSAKPTKTKLDRSVGSIVFNYSDIAYHPRKKNTYICKEEFTHHNRREIRTRLSMLRNTIDSIVNPEHIIVFYGKEKHFKHLFADYNFVIHYNTTSQKGEDLFIAKKSSRDQLLCFERNDEYQFVECKSHSVEYDYSQYQLKNEINNIDEELSSLKSLEGEELLPKDHHKLLDDTTKCKKTFKNFLREEY